MKTWPDRTPQEHIQAIRDVLRYWIPSIDTYSLRYCDLFNIKFQQDIPGRSQQVVSSADIGDEEELKEFIKRLCLEGREWMNLSGSGLLTDGSYLVIVEYSLRKDFPMTAINIPGPSLNRDGSIREVASIVIT